MYLCFQHFRQDCFKKIYSLLVELYMCTTYSNTGKDNYLNVPAPYSIPQVLDYEKEEMLFSLLKVILIVATTGNKISCLPSLVLQAGNTLTWPPAS